MMRPVQIAACGVALFAASAFASWATAGLLLPVAGAGAQITIAGYQFSPNPLTVTRGTQVTWVNTDGPAHAIASADAGGPLRSPRIESNASYSFVFTQPGTYNYMCAIHPRMTGTVVVR